MGSTLRSYQYKKKVNHAKYDNWGPSEYQYQTSRGPVWDQRYTGNGPVEGKQHWTSSGQVLGHQY